MDAPHRCRLDRPWRACPRRRIQVFDTDHSWALRSNVSGLQTAAKANRPIWLMDGFRGTMLANIDNLRPDRNFIDSIT
jgi:hypothetical protein